MTLEVTHKPVPRTLRSEVVDILRDAIMTGQLAPGERLKETAVAAQLSVSRSPVREAFRQLEQEGLIISVPNQGSFVRTFDEHDVREIFALRTVLEDLACETVMNESRLGPRDLAHLEGLVDEQRLAIDAEDFDRLTKLDMEFHEYLCTRSGMQRLLSMWQDLRAQIQIFVRQRFEAMDYAPETVHTDHAAIMGALQSGDPAQFSKINKEINERVAEECILMLRASTN